MDMPERFSGLAAYIKAHYRPRREPPVFASRRCDAALVCKAAPMAAPKASLEDYLKQEDAGFSEKLLALIDRSGRILRSTRKPASPGSISPRSAAIPNTAPPSPPPPPWPWRWSWT